MNITEKGKQLENAVEAIEKLIFETNPALKNSEIKIMRNRIIEVSGVIHEIVKPSIISKFDIERKGRYLEQEYNLINGEKFLYKIAILNR